MSNLPASRTDIIESKIDKQVTGALAMTSRGPTVPVFRTMGEIMEFAKVMSVSGVAVRKHLRNNPGACVAICLQAQRWEMDPFAVANKSYEVNDQIAYESQLISAVINTRAPIKERLKTRYRGEGPTRVCIVSGTFIGETTPTEVESPPISLINPKNSPLWKTDPDQQLSYYTKRLWARRECPEVLLGVYDIEEAEAIAAHHGPDNAKDITPLRPTRAQFVEPAVTEAEPEPEGVNQEPVSDPYLFVDAEGEEHEIADPMIWANRVASALRTASPQIADGLWETNSAQLARLREEVEGGAKFAQMIDDEYGKALRRDQETKKKEVLKVPKDKAGFDWPAAMTLLAGHIEAAGSLDELQALQTDYADWLKEGRTRNLPEYHRLMETCAAAAQRLSGE